jgi:Zn-dependent protease
MPSSQIAPPIPWSIPLGSLAGVPIRLHLTFFLLLAWIVLANLAGGSQAVLHALVFVTGVFTFVVLHELGHALAARRYGIRTADITLLPIGGLARLERLPRKPAQELWVAIAGPLVNVVLAAGFAVIMMLSGGWDADRFATMDLATGGWHALVLQFFAINVVLFTFNLLPAFPMDGGRILRALLAVRLGLVKATQIAARIGQALAIALGFVGLFANPVLIFVALFVFMGAAAEAQGVELEAALQDVFVRDAMLPEVRVLRADERLAEAVRTLLAGSDADFPVLRGEDLLGVLTRSGIIKALSEHGADAPLESVDLGPVIEFHPDDPLIAASRRLQEARVNAGPVVEEGRLVGWLTRDNLSDLIMVRVALRNRSQ